MARPGRTRSLAVVLAASAVAAGGLWTLTAAAQSPPSLPAVAPDQLVASVVRTMGTDPNVSGSVDVHVDLGVPHVVTGALSGQADGVASLLGDHRLRVWSSREGLRISDLLPLGERSVVVDRANGEGWAWDWNSFTAVRLGPVTAMGPSGASDELPPPFDLLDPLSLARRSLDALTPTTSVTVEATARVAGRAVYVLTLRPRTADTLVGRIELSVDAERRIPLRIAVFPRGADTAAVSAGFTSVSFGPVDPSVYSFVPPAGAKVERLRDLMAKGGHFGGGEWATNGTTEVAGLDGLGPYAQTFGSGWATVFAVRVPALPASSSGFDPSSLLPFSGNLFSIRLVERPDHAWLIYGAVPQSALAGVEDRLP
jgi:hypothetical protein